MKLIAIFVLLILVAPIAEGQGTASSRAWITSYSRRSGWPVPKYRGKCDAVGRVQLQNHIQLLSCGVGLTDVEIPRYVVELDGTLTMYSSMRYARTLYALAYNGIVYGYTADMFGRDVASVLSVTWTDEEGKGIFTKLTLGQPSEERIPEWVKLKGPAKH